MGETRLRSWRPPRRCTTRPARACRSPSSGSWLRWCVAIAPPGILCRLALTHSRRARSFLQEQTKRLREAAFREELELKQRLSGKKDLDKDKLSFNQREKRKRERGQATSGKVCVLRLSECPPSLRH